MWTVSSSTSPTLRKCCGVRITSGLRQSGMHIIANKYVRVALSKFVFLPNSPRSPLRTHVNNMMKQWTLQLPAVITNEYNNGVVVQVERLKLVEHNASVAVGLGYRSIVSSTKVTSNIIWHETKFWQTTLFEWATMTRACQSKSQNERRNPALPLCGSHE